MTVPIPPWRLSLTLVLLAALAGCGGAGQRPTGSAPGPASTAAVELSLATATDLFNRGENDLACDQVKRAVSLATAPLPVEQRAQLERYRKACESL